MLAQRPLDVFLYQAGGMVQTLLQGLDDGGGSRRIAQGDGNVAQPTFMSQTPDGGAFGLGKKRGLIPLEQLN